jgi:hypothetical protein
MPRGLPRAQGSLRIPRRPLPGPNIPAHSRGNITSFTGLFAHFAGLGHAADAPFHRPPSARRAPHLNDVPGLPMTPRLPPDPAHPNSRAAPSSSASVPIPRTQIDARCSSPLLFIERDQGGDPPRDRVYIASAAAALTGWSAPSKDVSSACRRRSNESLSPR